MNVDAQTMEGAKGAAKMAVESSIFNDESLTGAVEQRNVRKATYVPTFFTAQEQPVVHPLAASATNRFQRNAQVINKIEHPVWCRVKCSVVVKCII